MKSKYCIYSFLVFFGGEELVGSTFRPRPTLYICLSLAFFFLFNQNAGKLEENTPIFCPS